MGIRIGTNIQFFVLFYIYNIYVCVVLINHTE